jgi:RNA 2',3'-cyclic 3'-phosphodiesterase
MPNLRLFVALPTPGPIRASMGELVSRLRDSQAEVKWDTPDKFHCTLKFLGNTPEPRVSLLAEDLANIARQSPPLQIIYRTIGAFPALRDPRVIWLGLQEDSGALADLQQRIENAMRALGFPKEDRAFHPHVTLGRVKGRLSDLITRLESVTFESKTAVIADLELIRSDLRPTGSVYTTVRSFPLGKPTT